MSLVYHSHEFHVMDLKVKIFIFRKYLIYLNQPFECLCHDISFGSVDEVMTVSSNQCILQSTDEHSACSSRASNTIGSISSVKKPESLLIGRGKSKVIIFYFLLKLSGSNFLGFNLDLQKHKKNVIFYL